jgi:hypothetical protein
VVEQVGANIARIRIAVRDGRATWHCGTFRRAGSTAATARICGRIREVLQR